MKTLALFTALLLLKSGVFARNAWERSRNDRAVIEAEDRIRMRTLKTSIIVYDKVRMTECL